MAFKTFFQENACSYPRPNLKKGHPSGLIAGFIGMMGFLQACSPAVKSGFLTLTSISSSTNTTLTTAIPSQLQYEGVVVNLGSAFVFENICGGNTIFGRTGYASCTMSDVYRDVGSAQLNQADEYVTYSGNGSTPSLPSNDHEVPVVSTDDDGYNTTDVDPTCANGCTPVVEVTAAQHAAFQTCGTTPTTIAGRIADCANTNGSAATWSGAADGTRGEATWLLVTQSGLNQEVWQDQRTGLLWSSIVGTNNWCQAAGNSQSTDATCSGNTVSYCKEVLAPAIGGENWVASTPGTYTYSTAKGGMGAYSSPAVQWRLPTLYDYEQADVDGIRFVMPDMGSHNTGGIEWSATTVSNSRTQAWPFYSDFGQGTAAAPLRSASQSIRCVGR